MPNDRTNPAIFKDIKIMVIDDEEILAWSIETELKSQGADVLSCAGLRLAIENFVSFNPDLAICDLRLPDGSGIELLKKWRHEKPDMPVILITAHGGVESAIDALRLGAFDYLQKPFDMKSLLAAVKRAAEMSKLRQKVSRMTGSEEPQDPVKIIGSSKAMEEVKRQVRRIASSKASTTLICGESGTGKELIARAIHEWSPRAYAPFVEINCASIPETLLESELFGYEKGAFTDARERKLGLFEMAQNGTIFLDEIGEMPMKLQSKLLRALEYRRFKRLGGTKDIVFTARIVAATNRNILEEIQAKRFRGDLYYRLSSLPVILPPLRQRKDDIDLLVEFFLEKLASELEMKRPETSPEVLRILREHNWPGNIRELKNVLERAMVFYQPSSLKAEHLTFDQDLVPDSSMIAFSHQASMPQRGPYHPAEAFTNGEAKPQLWTLPENGIDLEVLEKELLIQALDRARNNQTKAASLLGISRHTFRYRLEKYGIANH